jgi:hypothetical protein
VEAVNLDGQEFAASFHGDAEAHATTFSTASTSGTQYGNAGTFGIGTLVVGFWEIILGYVRKSRACHRPSKTRVFVDCPPRFRTASRVRSQDPQFSHRFDVFSRTAVFLGHRF